MLMVTISPSLRQYPLTPPFDVLIEHDANVHQDESTHDEAKELRSVSGAQFESNVGRRGMPQSRIFRLTDNLIYNSC